MADSNVAVTPGVGANIDTRTAPDGDHRQVMVLGDGTGAQTVYISPAGGLAIRGTPLPNINGVIAANTPGVVSADISEAGNATFWVSNSPAATPYGGAPVLVFEQSVDNVSWSPLGVMRSDNGTLGSTFVLGAGSANTSIPFNASMPGINWVRVRVTTAPTSGSMAITIDPGSLPFQPIVNIAQAPRTPAVFYTSAPQAATATDTLVSLTVTRNNTTVAATATPAVVAPGRSLRLQSMDLGYIATTAGGYGIVKIRVNPTGAVTTASPVVRAAIVGAGTPASANSVGMVSVSFGDGIDVPAGAGVGISVQGATGITAAAVGYVHALVAGYEF